MVRGGHPRVDRFFVLMLARSGIEVLSSFPKMYRNDGCPPGRFLTRHTQSLLALEMNGAPLPIARGAPLRVSTIGMGQGGYREDQLYHANAAGI